jgi:hypothetical protein
LAVWLVGDVRASKSPCHFSSTRFCTIGRSRLRVAYANPVQRGYVNVVTSGIRRRVLQVRPFGNDPVEMIEISL